MLMAALTAVTVLPPGAFAQERQPFPRTRVQIDDEPQVIRERIRALTQRRARLGVNVDLRASDADSIGATLLSVTPGGPAAKAGLKSGDIVTRIGGKSLTASDNTKRAVDESLPAVRLIEYAAQLKPEETITIEYRRGATRHSATLVTGDEPIAMVEVFPGGGEFSINLPRIQERSPLRGSVHAETGPGGFTAYAYTFGGPLADLELAPLNTDLGAYFGSTEGVLVINIPKESTLGLRGGDVILSVDGRKATSPTSLLRILRTYEPGESFKLEIMRNKARTTITSQFEK
jgi:S1-C subfamily serine protease